MIKTHIPNALTLGNLTCGCIGIVGCTKGDLELASYMIWIAALFDFLDGFVARLLKVDSPIGKELDSLADMVTFGVLPSFILFGMLEKSTHNYWPYLAFSLALFSALRLAKFNIDTRQMDGFIGMPTPAAAFFVSGLVFWPSTTFFVGNTMWLLIITAMLSLLLLVPIPMLALKFKDYSIKHNIYRYLTVVVSVALLIMLGLQSFPVIISFYVGLSLFAAIKDEQVRLD